MRFVPLQSKVVFQPFWCWTKALQNELQDVFQVTVSKIALGLRETATESWPKSHERPLESWNLSLWRKDVALNQHEHTTVGEFSGSDGGQVQEVSKWLRENAE